MHIDPINWNAIIAICEIIGVIAIVITLIFLSVQVKQSNILARAQTRKDMLNTANHELEMKINHTDIWKAFVQESVTLDQRIQLNIWLINHMRNREFEWFQKQEETIDDGTFYSYANAIAFAPGTKRTRKWWEFSKEQFHPEFVKFDDEYTKDKPLTDYFGQIEKWD